MSGLLALLDDVAGLAKLAAASVDDVAGQAFKTTAKVAGTALDDAAKAGTKAAGALIDDAAVTPKYTHGLPAARELPIVGRIAWGSIRNKFIILLPAALLLSAFAPWAIAPLLMLGGCYLCFEGAEKVLHVLRPHADHVVEKGPVGDPAHLEETRVAGAIKTDFILSAEIMTIALSAIPDSGILSMALTLALVAVGITAMVYGSVAVIVKADDLGLLMAERGRLGITRAIGRGIVRWMPRFMSLLMVVGTAAMLWVGGNIVIHGMEVLDVGAFVGHAIHDVAERAAHAVPEGIAGAVAWAVTAFLDGVFGLILGMLLVPIVSRVILPAAGMFTRKA
ncbi:DUF808 domain-containing protein [Tropicimonas isoalkanivorans]|uniref:Inner membrane protein YedI n=1 Tax=Tropicimonas isoalkanivorans TaxID=441112 RepID=A0A1I1E7G5_9RHOB|nr:DUF808 domain-containing protein [Tropicimonas isoalkanivorans]SFB80900.1 hypothetical protein SAMN04488094_101582 [Tropicimonas isoalkanivorans]